MKLSIIIPVYNVEKYIGACIQSCLAQDLPLNEYEIIVVNDETPDNSIAVVEQFQTKYDNIQIVNKPNGGLSSTRNTGLKEAIGDYVWFVDGDDRIKKNIIKQLSDYAHDNVLDVLCFGITLVFPDGKEQIYTIEHKKCGEIVDGKNFIVNVKMPASGCVAFYRREFLICNNLYFYERILHEDQEFTPRAYCTANRIAYINIPVYYYFQREGSIMKSFQNIKRCQDLLTIADSLFAFATKHLQPDSEPYKVMMQKVYFCVTQSLAFYSTDANLLSAYKKRPYYPMDTTILSGSMKYKAMIANISLSLYLFLYKYLK